MTSKVQLGPNAHLFPAMASFQSQASFERGQQPSIVLLLGWFSASMSSLLKYVDMHRTLYPTADIVLVETPTPMLPFSDTENERETYLVPMVEFLTNRIYSNENQNHSSSGLLVHLFSNGGALQLKTISTMLHRRRKYSLSGNPCFAFVIDSSPGSEEYKALANALTALYSKSSTAVKAGVQIPILMMVYAYYLVNIKLLRNRLILPPVREYMEQTRLLPGSEADSPRLYIYSDTDDVVSASSVERHLANIREKNICFRVERFDGSAHVSHMPQDPSRYCRAITSLWTQASIRESAKL